MLTGLKETVIEFYEARTQPSLMLMWKTKQPIVWVLALAIGLLGALAIMAFRYVIDTTQWLWIGTTAENIAITIVSSKPWWQVMAGPVIAGGVVGVLLTYFTPGRRAEGMADVIAARAVKGAYMPWKNGVMSAVISSISIGAGGSAGREGPAVHMAATIASVLGTKFSLSFASRRVLLGCGAAAAVSASFNAPIAGVLFAHEVILGHYAASAIFPIVMSSVSATLLMRYFMGDFPTFALPVFHINSTWEFPAFLLLGLVCGLVAVAFQISMATADRTAKSIHMPLWARPVLGGVLIGALAVFVPEIIGVGYEATNLALRAKYETVGTYLLLLFAKTLATIITLASRFGGGVFSPSLYLGAMTGGAFGLIASSLFPDLSSQQGVYALVGMGAVAGAILGAPMSTVLIVFELTGGYEMTIALLLAVTVATTTTKVLAHQSLFAWQLSMRGIFLEDGPQRQIVKSWLVKDFLIPLETDEACDFSDDPDRPTLKPQDTLEKALQTFAKGNYTRIAVFKDPQDTSTHIGWADYTEALNEYNKALVEANEEEHR